MPRMIHFLLGARPSKRQLANVQRARELHPDSEVKVWQPPFDSAGFVLAKYWSKVNSDAQLADLVRLEVLYQNGGFMLDGDLELLKRLDELQAAYPFVIATADGTSLSTSVLASESHNPAIGELINGLADNEVDWKLPAELTTGAQFLGRELKWQSDVTVVPRDTFYRQNGADSYAWSYGTVPADHLARLLESSRSNASFPKRIAAALRRSRYRLLLLGRASLMHLRRLLKLERGVPYQASGVICAETIHGPKIYLLGEDASVTPHIAFHGTYEFEDELFVKRIIRHGDWVVDVGANVGIFSLIFADCVGPFGRVFCYEPNPTPAALLDKSLMLNWLHDRAIVRKKAIGSECGTSTLRFNRGRLGDATLSLTGTAGSFDRTIRDVATEQVDVEVSTLDVEFPVDLPIRLLKIDAEGFEHHVLRGAERLLKSNCIDVLMLECVQEVHGKNWQAYLRELDTVIGYGYSPYQLNRSSRLRAIKFSDILTSDRGRNLVLISSHGKATISELSP